MKNLLKSVTAAMVITILFSMIPFFAECSDLSDNVFRLHILANSDSEADQQLKLKVRDSVLRYTEKLYKNADSFAQAENLTKKQLQSIADVAQQTVYDNGYDYRVKAEIKNMYFNTRVYGDVTMPSGFYDALRITIGKGEGHNWWCVMYPSLCVGSSVNYNSLKENTTSSEYNMMTSGGFEFRFKLLEYFQKFCSLFS